MDQDQPMIIPACHGINCIALLWLGVTTQMHTPPPTGYLSAYGQLPTDATIRYRQDAGQIPNDLSGYDVLLAVLDCGDIGTAGLLYTDGGVFEALVFDCAGVADGGAAWMIQGDYVAETDYYFWAEYPELIGTMAALVLDD